MINSFVINIFIISLACTGIMFLFLILRKFTEKYVSAAWRTIIWMLILLRICIPYIGELPIGIINLNTSDSVTAPILIDENNNLNFENSNTDYYDVSYNNADSPLATAKNPIKFSWFSALGFVYLVGLLSALILLIIKFITSRMYLNRLERCGSDEINNLLHIVKQQMRIKRKVTVLVDEKAEVPFVCGIVNVHIIIPKSDTKKIFQQLRLIFLHELMHCKHNDILKLWILELALCINWFNPLLYFLKNTIIQDLEIACDENVLSMNDNINAYQYSLVISEYSLSQNKHSALLPSYGLARGNNSLLKKRLSTINKFKKRKLKSISILLCILIVFTTMSCTSINTLKSRLPSSFDWREKGVVSTPQNQGEYYTGAVFAAISIVESYNAKATGALVDLSEQYFINSIDNSFENTGISPEEVLIFCTDNGTTDESTMPYTGSTSTLTVNQDIKHYFIPSWESVVLSEKSPPDQIETIKQTLHNFGPAITNIEFYKDMKTYSGGVFKSIPSNSANCGHWVCIVGWNDDESIETGGYWIVKESWGTNWGEQGYIKIPYNDLCGINDYILYYISSYT